MLMPLTRSSSALARASRSFRALRLRSRRTRTTIATTPPAPPSAAGRIHAGVGCFGLAGLVSGYLPLAHLNRIPMKTVEEITPEVSYEFIDLSKRFPEQFKKYYGEPNLESFRKALRLGRDTYIGEACWHLSLIHI